MQYLEEDPMREKTTLRRPVVAGGLAVALLLIVGFATPVHAATRSTARMSCEWVDGSGTIHLKLEATASHEDDWQAQVRRWSTFSYRLIIVEGVNSTNKNNVNIRLYELDNLVYALNSPDNRRYGIWYRVIPVNTVTTSLPAHDHRTRDMIEFEAIFDLPVATDPKCTAWTKVPPG
jgi:hypothetical protein